MDDELFAELLQSMTEALDHAKGKCDLRTTCTHPLDQRWQYPDFWMCCVCSAKFWGDKRAPVSKGMIAGMEDAHL